MAGAAAAAAATALQAACAAAGAAVGAAEGLWRATSHQPHVPALHEAKPSAARAAGRPLLNVLIAGDDARCRAAAAHALTGQPCQALSDEAELLLLNNARLPACCVWNTGGRAAAAALGPRFFSRAAAALLVYDPAADAHPAAALHHWAGLCCGGGGEVAALASPPLVVAAVCGDHGGGSAEHAAVAEAERWCRASGGVPHCRVHGLQDECGAQAVCVAVLGAALRRRAEQLGGALPGGGPAELPALLQSELRAPLLSLNPLFA